MQAKAERQFYSGGTVRLFLHSSGSARIVVSTKSVPRNISTNYERTHESAANVDGKSTGKPAASREALDGHVFTECRMVVCEQAVEATKHLQVRTWMPSPPYGANC